MEVQEAQRFLLCMELMIRRAQEDSDPWSDCYIVSAEGRGK